MKGHFKYKYQPPVRVGDTVEVVCNASRFPSMTKLYVKYLNSQIGCQVTTSGIFALPTISQDFIDHGPIRFTKPDRLYCEELLKMSGSILLRINISIQSLAAHSNPFGCYGYDGSLYHLTMGDFESGNTIGPIGSK